MEHSVARATDSHIQCDGIFECLLGEDIAGPKVLLNEIHDLHTGALGQPYPVGVDGGDGAVPW